MMGGRYGGDIKRGGRGTSWSTKRALEAIGRETLEPFEGIGRRTRSMAKAKSRFDKPGAMPNQ